MRRERRKHFRVEWNSPATIYDGQLPRCCIVSNFSNGGAKIVGVKATTIPDEFMLRITPGHGRIRKCRVLWRSDDAIRVQFIDRIASAEEPYVANTVRERDTIIMPR
jgi:PilZ domain-containing protein